MEVVEAFEYFYDVGADSYLENINRMPSQRVILPLLSADHVNNNLINLVQIQIIVELFLVKPLTLLNGVRLPFQFVL